MILCTSSKRVITVSEDIYKFTEMKEPNFLQSLPLFVCRGRTETKPMLQENPLWTFKLCDLQQYNFPRSGPHLSFWQVNRLYEFSAPRNVSSSRISMADIQFGLKSCAIYEQSWQFQKKEYTSVVSDATFFCFVSHKRLDAVILLTSSKVPSIGLYASNDTDLMRSPMRIKSPFVFRYKAMMLLKKLHSTRSSLSPVHSNNLTCNNRYSSQLS